MRYFLFHMPTLCLMKFKHVHLHMHIYIESILYFIHYICMSIHIWDKETYTFVCMCVCDRERVHIYILPFMCVYLLQEIPFNRKLPISYTIAIYCYLSNSKYKSMCCFYNLLRFWDRDFHYSILSTDKKHFVSFPVK